MLREKSQSVDDISIEGEDYQALSTKEESDLELLMSECQVAISNAEVFTEQLSKQLSVLDGVCAPCHSYLLIINVRILGYFITICNIKTE